MQQKYKILLSGGSTGGSVSPLLAIVEQLKKEDKYEFLWLGTKSGPEIIMVQQENIKYISIFSGKYRRYFSIKNLFTPIFVFLGFFQSLFIILKWKPNLIISAGSFSSVPVIWTGWLIGIPSLIHQQDILAGLANKLMAPFAKIITVSFEQSLSDYGSKAIWVGQPIRDFKFTKTYFQLKKDLPVVLIIGGGTGSAVINNLIRHSLDHLLEFCQVIHITGKNKGDKSGTVNSSINSKYKKNNYYAYEFLNKDQMAAAYTSAQIVVSRCGINILSELSYFFKPAIIIPLPDSHQENNAIIFKDAAIILKQNKITTSVLLNEIKKLLEDKNLQNKLSINIKRIIKPGATERIIKIINNILFVT